MKLKSLLFGSAAAIVTVTGAQAADLPIAEPVEYVRICDAYGAGYYYIPGTETCLKIGGFVRFDMYYTPGDDDGVDFFDDDDDFDFFGTDDEDYNNFATRARFGIELDARTQTSLGILRSYIALESTVGPASTGFYDGNDSAYFDKGFIQLLMDAGTLTAGRTDSFFDYDVTKSFNVRFGDDDYTYTTNLLAYTFAFGNGFSATLSLEDARSSGRESYGFGGFFDSKFSDFDGQEMPDLVAALRVDQGWGSAQVMGAVGKLELDDPFDDDDDGEWGWAAGAGVTVAVPNTMFEVGLVGIYADGLIDYATTQNGIGFPSAYYSIDGDSETSTAWSVQGSIKAGVTENGWVALSGTYANIEADDVDYLDDGDFEGTTWTAALTGGVDVVPGLFVGAEVAYEKVDVSFDDDWDGPGADDFDVDDDVLNFTFRMQRDF